MKNNNNKKITIHYNYAELRKIITTKKNVLAMP
jgi:hypothetical protein